MNIEQFLTEHPSSPSAAFTRHSALADEVREAANRGWQIFPVTQIAKLTGNPDLLIFEATSEFSCLEELSTKYSPCEWRIAVGPSSICVVRLDEPSGRSSFAAASQYDGECLTLQAHRGDIALAFFRRPAGLQLRSSAKKLAPGLMVIADGDSCTLLPFDNPWADVEALPYALRELLFETPDSPSGKKACLPVSSPRRSPCRPAAHFSKPHRTERKGFANYNQAGWRNGYRIHRQS